MGGIKQQVGGEFPLVDEEEDMGREYANGLAGVGKYTDICSMDTRLTVTINTTFGCWRRRLQKQSTDKFLVALAPQCEVSTAHLPPSATYLAVLVR